MGPRLANDFPAIDTTRFREYITPTQHIFAINEINSKDVYNIIHSLNLSKGGGLDGISWKLLLKTSSTSYHTFFNIYH